MAYSEVNFKDSLVFSIKADHIYGETKKKLSTGPLPKWPPIAHPKPGATSHSVTQIQGPKTLDCPFYHFPRLQARDLDGKWTSQDPNRPPIWDPRALTTEPSCCPPQTEK